MKLGDPGMRLGNELAEQITKLLDTAGATEQASLAAFGPDNRPTRILVATDRGVARLTISQTDHNQARVEGPLLRWKDAGITLILAADMYRGQDSPRYMSRVHVAEGEGVTFERSEDGPKAFDDFALLIGRQISKETT